jgi:hypothetical protein
VAEKLIESCHSGAAVAGGQVSFGFAERVGGKALAQFGDRLAAGAESSGGFQIVPTGLGLTLVGPTLGTQGKLVGHFGEQLLGGQIIADFRVAEKLAGLFELPSLERFLGFSQF